jgi:type II secretory pathway component PulC
MTLSQFTRTINWVAMPIALALLAMVAYHIYQRHFEQRQTGVNYQFDDLPTANKAPVKADVNAIVDKHVFGRVPEIPKQLPAVVKKAEPVKQAPKTKLNIKLTGIIVGTTPENGMAMLEVERGRTLVVSVGQKIGKTDAILHQVLPGEVLIDRDGTIESIKMARKTLSLARLDSELLSNLPQPYIEQPDEQAVSEQSYSSGVPKAVQTQPKSAYQPAANQKPETTNSSAHQEPAEQNSEPITRSAVSGTINRFPIPASRRREQGTPKKVPIPRALRN